MDLLFVLNSMLLGVGLAMDAFSVSLANGLGEPKMRRFKMTATAGTFAFFQALMPMIGWVCVHTIVTYFTKVQKAIPVIALLLLLYIGISMLIEGARGGSEDGVRLTPKKLFIQGIATSI
ncbi:MAG: manganese efflux pump, partial [Ruminococcus sp.]|nr:manganese efflux pump [Ruminococcus sp.]